MNSDHGPKAYHFSLFITTLYVSFPQNFLIVSIKLVKSPSDSPGSTSCAQALSHFHSNKQAASNRLVCFGLLMPRQKIVAMGRKAKPGTYSRGQGRGRGRATGSSRRTKNSVIPGAKTTGPKLKLKLNMGVGGGQQSAAHPSIIDFDQLNEQQAEEEEEEDLPVAGPVVGSLRSGRSVKQPKADDYVYGSEIDVQMPSSMGKESDEQYRSSPPRKLTWAVPMFTY
jgi:hypothetical protein